MEFAGKVALITGASVGIGRAVAHLLAERGADLVLLDIDGVKLKAVYDELQNCPGEIKVYTCDVSKEEQVNKAVSEALGVFGRIDILVNNAAIWRSRSSFLELSTEEWNRYLSTNVMSVVYCTKAVLAGMIKNGYGRIINVASVAGVYGNARMVHYSATKGAVISMTKALAKEVVNAGVLVNAVSPGSVSPSSNEDIDHHVPTDLSYMGRTGTDRENAELICFLASDRNSYMTGQNIQIDGCRKRL